MSDNFSASGRVPARFAAGFLPVFAVCAAWLLVVWMDVIVLATHCAENSLVEWTQFALVFSTGAIMATLAARMASCRAGFILAAVFFLDMAIREQDRTLDMMMGRGSWSALVVICTGLSLIAAFRPRWRGTLRGGVKAILDSRHLPVLAIGLMTILGISRAMGMKHLWAPLGRSQDLGYAKRMVEESMELFGYGLVFLWAILFSRECLGHMKAASSREKDIA